MMGKEVDEMDPIARITGFSSIERKSVGHMLNMRACALRYATQNNAKYPELSLIVAHMAEKLCVSDKTVSKWECGVSHS